MRTRSSTKKSVRFSNKRNYCLWIVSLLIQHDFIFLKNIYILVLNFDILCIQTYMQKDLVIYEMNVRGFTADESSGLPSSTRGSYLGVIEKVGIIMLNLSAMIISIFFSSSSLVLTLQELWWKYNDGTYINSACICF